MAARGLLALFHPSFSASQTNSLLIIGTLAGELPDIDLICLYFAGKGCHRNYVTHTPLFWLAISMMVTVVGSLAGSLFVQWIGWIVIACSWSHLLLDSIEEGVMWLWPWSKRRFALKEEPAHEDIDARPGSLEYHFKYVNRVYLKSVTIWAEIAVTIAALILLLRSFWPA